MSDIERLKSFERLMKQSKRKLADRVWQLKERIVKKEKANAAQALLLDEYRKEISELKKRLALFNVVGRSEQLPCDCGVQLKETTIQVFCPKCYKTWKVK